MTPSASHAQRAAELAFLLPRLRRFARVLTRRTEDADELVRAALQRALAPQWQAGGPLDDAVFRLIKTAWLEAPEARTGASRAHGESLDSAIDQAVAALPVRQRLLVALVLVDGRSYRQAAAILDMPVGEIGAELARARQALHTNLPAHARTHP
jgi:RNA polymerase sigma-70 factor (ECF subfamily)